MGVRYIFGQDGAFRTEPVIVAKNITENGTYDPATEGADGYAPVTVNVEGGGGSSDFSTAEVTVVNNAGTETARGLLMTIIIERTNMLTVYGVPSGIYTVPIFKGALNTAYLGDGTAIVSGNAEYDDGDITITGDCTITIS